MAEKVTLPEVTILGRTVQFKQFNDTQLVLIHRMRQMLAGATAAMPTEPTKEPTDAEKQALETSLDVVSRFLDMIGFMVVSDVDRDWLTMQMLAGNLDLTEIGKFVPNLVGEDVKPKAPVKKAVRAR